MRDTFHDDLDRIGSTLIEMTSLVSTAMAQATEALLEADIGLADAVISSDSRIDVATQDIEELSFDLLARQQPVATDLRTIVTSLRMVADLERMGDLALHIAKVARMRYPNPAVPGELRDTVREMGHVAERIVAKTGDVVAGKDLALASELETDDDVMDALHKKLFSVLLFEDWPYGVESAIDITLLGRYYERFADHAVSVARRIVYLVTGEMPRTAA
ncbi:MAG: phosphate signaling complex protein PhoU [Mycobacteriales bacterium]